METPCWGIQEYVPHVVHFHKVSNFWRLTGYVVEKSAKIS
jgi:hypothetical protein